MMPTYWELFKMFMAGALIGTAVTIIAALLIAELSTRKRGGG